MVSVPYMSVAKDSIYENLPKRGAIYKRAFRAPSQGALHEKCARLATKLHWIEMRRVNAARRAVIEKIQRQGYDAWIASRAISYVTRQEWRPKGYDSTWEWIYFPGK